MKKLLLLVAPVLMFSNLAFAQSAIEPPLITVTGQAEVRVPPDEVVFALVIEAMDKDVLAANKKTDESVREVLATARRNNIKPEDIQTSQISVQPKYNTDDMEYSERSTVKRVLIGYQVSKTIGIRLRDISRFEVILADVLKAGITQLTNLQFRDSQMRKHKDQARAMAIRAAREKANLLAREIGQTIGPAYSITEEAQNFANSNINQNVSIARSSSTETESDRAIAPGSISVTAEVTVKFRLN